MCGGLPSSTTRGERLPPITPWEILWKRIYFEWMWFWCWSCYRSYTAIPAPDTHASRYGRFNMWLLGYAGAYANSTRADFHLCNFFYRTEQEQKLAWDSYLALSRPHRGGAA